MRIVTASLLFLLAPMAMITPCAADSISSQDAVSRARSAGYVLVSRTEAAPGAWDLWASKEGIAYEVKISARDGSLIAAVPLEDND